MTARQRFASWRTLTTVLLSLALVAAACGSDEATAPAATARAADGGTDAAIAPTDAAVTLRIGAIPDQEPERLQRTYDLLAEYLESEMPGVSVEYVPVTDYQGAISAFRAGDLDIVWFGGLTGVQARLEVEGAEAIAQRDIDAEFTSVFIAAADAGIEPITDVAGLEALAGHTFTFGSESSTSGRLMPQSFLSQAGLDIETSFDGPPGFSGSHDATIELVAAGTYTIGALNSQVWDSRVADGTVDPAEVVEIFRTPPFYDYHWVAGPGVSSTDAFLEAILALDPTVPSEAEILELFGAESFITTENGNYAAIEAVGRDADLIR